MDVMETIKGKYRTITLRVPWTETTVLNWLDSQQSMNSAILNLIREDMGLLAQSPDPEPIKEYEVIEEKGRFKVTLGSFNGLKEAEHFARVILTVFEDSEKIMIIRRRKNPVSASVTSETVGEIVNTFEQTKEEK